MHLNQKYKLILLLCTLHALLPTIAMARPEMGAEMMIAADLLHFGYRELDDNGKLFDQEDGFIPGVSLKVSHTSEQWVWAGDFSFHGGDVNYTGQASTGIPITTHTTQNIAEINVRSEYWLDTRQSFSYAFYLGTGYHYWKRDIHPTTTSGGSPVSGLLETYSWWLVFLGMKAEIYQTDTSLWLIDARLTNTINPQIIVDFNGINDTTTLDLGERMGFRVSLPSRYPLNSSTGLSIEPYVESYELGRSKTSPLYRNGALIGAVNEPYSQTINYGLSIGISQHF